MCSGSQLGASLAGNDSRELNQRVSEMRAQKGLDMPRMVTEGELGEIQTRLGELALKWKTLTPGGTLELPFPAD